MFSRTREKAVRLPQHRCNELETNQHGECLTLLPPYLNSSALIAVVSFIITRLPSLTSKNLDPPLSHEPKQFSALDTCISFALASVARWPSTTKQPFSHINAVTEQRWLHRLREFERRLKAEREGRLQERSSLRERIKAQDKALEEIRAGIKRNEGGL